MEMWREFGNLDAFPYVSQLDPGYYGPYMSKVVLQDWPWQGMLAGCHNNPSRYLWNALEFFGLENLLCHCNRLKFWRIKCEEKVTIWSVPPLHSVHQQHSRLLNREWGASDQGMACEYAQWLKWSFVFHFTSLACKETLILQKQLL